MPIVLTMSMPEWAQILETVGLGLAVLIGIIAIVVGILRGEVQKFIVAKMEEAEAQYKDLPKPEKSIKKLEYVVNAVKEKYKIADLIMNVRKFIEKIVEINNKDM